MNLTSFVDIAIALSVIYLGVSLFVTIINEYIAQIFNLRAKQLRRDLQKLIDGSEGVEALTNNPVLAPFFGGNFLSSQCSTYVDPKVLAQQLIGGLQAGVAASATMDAVFSSLGKMKDSTLKRQLLAIAAVSTQSVENFVDNVSVWVDRSLIILGEGYKKHSKTRGFWLGLLLAGVLNIDTVGIVTHLYRDKEARDAISVIGSNFVQNTSKETFEKCSKTLSTINPESDAREKSKPDPKKDPECASINELLNGLQERNKTFAKLPIGWTNEKWSNFPSLTSIFGFFLTALAVSLGSSFWFDLLNRLVNIRHGMRRPELEKSSETPTGK